MDIASYAYVVAAAVAVVLIIVSMAAEPMVDVPDVPDVPAASANHIIDNLYVGNWESSISPGLLRRLGIRAVLTLNWENTHTPADEAAFKRLGIRHMVVRIEDSPDANIWQHLQKCLNFIEAARPGAVLVHCTAGISRSGSVAVAYIMRRQGVDVVTATQYAKSRRPIIWPNKGFRDQLSGFAATAP
jgi:protein tyrosine phosphatase